MITAILIVTGLCFGSFVNALVWRVHEQSEEVGKKKPSIKYLRQLSLSKGRSMCPRCQHELGAKDLVPIFSWVSLRGKCRYCAEVISWQYPAVEAVTALLFLASYLYWPIPVEGVQVLSFVLWLGLVVGFMALIVYDLRWLLLPNRIMVPLGAVAGLMAIVGIATAAHPVRTGLDTILAVAIGGGIFYVLFQVSAGKWIGGGDVKLGWLLGLVVATPARALLLIFAASALGSLISLPLLAAKRVKPSSVIPFGPFLILAAILVQLFGHSILYWYQRNFITL